jgi:DNA-binding NarL/FixJ family response regulator
VPNRGTIAVAGFPGVRSGRIRGIVERSSRPRGGFPIPAPSPADRPTRVGLVDDHPSVLASVAIAIEAAPDLMLVGTTTTIDGALTLAGLVDVLVCDIQLDGRAEGLRVLESVHGSGMGPATGAPAVLILSGFEQSSLVRAAIERGAAGFVGKASPVAEIVSAIRTVARGGTVYTAAALQSSQTAMRRPSDRELEVLDGIRAGSTNAEVAAGLGLSEKTIESHLRRLFDRYGVLSRTELIVLAIDEGWIPTGRGRS